MEIVFSDKDLENLYITGFSKTYSKEVILWFFKKVLILKNIKTEQELRNLKSLHYEKLNNYSKWNHSIRINDKYRIIFNILEREVKIIEITDLNNHYK